VHLLDPVPRHVDRARALSRHRRRLW
jgi:hypothetical protein